ncbi:MAG: UDP-N-acetylmuramate--L-alanine ligase [Candidatus Magasanikbacteria bacterium]|nr:UDP-N-acetylmuramate--L-alanine ligase [Candidatus Magasanikbacteria bacterium]
MNFKDIKNVYCIGIGGIGVSAVAKFFRAQGARVSGFDACATDITHELEQMGIPVYYIADIEHIMSNVELAIYSPAVPPEQRERREAEKLGILALSYPEFLGELSKEYYTIAITGTNGKSTTAALTALMLAEAGLDPTVFVGSKVPQFPLGNVRIGASKYLVVEACEYRAHMLNIEPQAIVLTNIASDHLDYYRDLAHIQETFLEFINTLPPAGLLIANADDAPTRTLSLDIRRVPYYLKRFGTQGVGEYQATHARAERGGQRFTLLTYKGDVLSIELHVPGAFNVANALAAAAMAHEMGVAFDIIQKVLQEFKGIWRRFEFIDEILLQEGAPPVTIISDYGHHPDAIIETIKGARAFFPGRRVVLVYQPHQHNRTQKLFNEFVEVLQEPDLLLLSDIYDVEGRVAEEDREAHSSALAEAIAREARNDERYHYTGGLDETREWLSRAWQPGDVVIIMGAGDIDTIARNLPSYE